MQPTALNQAGVFTRALQKRSRDPVISALTSEPFQPSSLTSLLRSRQALELRMIKRLKVVRTQHTGLMCNREKQTDPGIFHWNEAMPVTEPSQLVHHKNIIIFVCLNTQIWENRECQQNKINNTHTYTTSRSDIIGFLQMFQIIDRSCKFPFRKPENIKAVGILALGRKTACSDDCMT